MLGGGVLLRASGVRDMLLERLAVIVVVRVHLEYPLVESAFEHGGFVGTGLLHWEEISGDGLLTKIHGGGRIAHTRSLFAAHTRERAYEGVAMILLRVNEFRRVETNLRLLTSF